MEPLEAPSCPPELQALVDRFARNEAEYKSGRYKETEVRREFIDPLFKLFGWDVDNDQGYSEAYKDVVHEYSLSVKGSARAPDYCFRIGGQRKFFVEAKAPHVDLENDPGPAQQVRRYGWNAKIPLSILTDFEEFIIFDTRIPPKPADGPGVARKRVVRYTEYVSRWPMLWGTFSKDAVLKGSFDKYADSTRAKGTVEVDKAFLGSIETWRYDLARNLALRNEALTQDELNYAVQTILDRIIFLRICEDRGIEPEGRLRRLIDDKDPLPRLKTFFEQADQRYNSGLFHLEDEKGRGGTPDEITPGLSLDAKVIKDIVKGLYFPDCQYEFSVLPPEILGHVYEQFLGKVIRLTPGHRAVIEEKPEVRKAGGVYYTPSHIVECIVKETLAPFLEGKTPETLGDLRIVDPACGSGSFLIGAYQHLLDWHQEYYNQLGVRKRKDFLYEAPDGWLLKAEERKRILTKHIYGVDIDPQAVEVTKLSLLLKVLEKTAGETLDKNQKLMHERALPDLESNVKCGNTLLDHIHIRQLLLDDEARRRINAFDWKTEFPHVFADGGFHAVIGNPPYIRIQAMKEWAPQEVDLYKKHYVSASKGNYDIYVCFVERGLKLLRKDGQLGYILPHKFFNAKYGQPLRGLIAEGKNLRKIVHFGDQQVFHGATTYTCLLFLGKSEQPDFAFDAVTELSEWQREGIAESGHLQADSVTDSDWTFSVNEAAPILSRVEKESQPLDVLAERMAQGIRTSANPVYVVQEKSRTGSTVQAESAALESSIEVEDVFLYRFLQGREIKPFSVRPSGKQVIIPYTVNNGMTLVDWNEIKSQAPKTAEYLSANKATLVAREKGKMDGAGWYGYVYPKNVDVMQSPKILVPDIADRASFALDEDGKYAFTSGYGITLKDGVPESVKYVLGLLNSHLLDAYLKSVSTTMRGGFFRYFTQFVKQLPIRRIDFSDPEDQARHDRMVSLVETMLDLHKRLDDAKGHDKNLLERQIAATGQEINELVYELYGLTDEEIQIIEEASK